jgi:N-acetylglucosamine-6-phosphate deacetylase
MRIALENARILTPYREVEGGLLIDGGKIERLFEGSAPAADRVMDVKGRYASPGFIDIHSHGGGGFDYLDGTLEAFEGAGGFHMRHGATSITPTFSASSDEELLRALSVLREAKMSATTGPNLIGAHLEGPYFSQEQRGAQDARCLRLPDPAHYLRILGFSQDIVRWSFAPELPGALDLATELKKRGILAAIGHSDATYQEILPAVERGCALVTHLYSGCSLLRRVDAYRRMGVVESAFAIDELSVEVIADGRHLPPELLSLIVKLKPWDKIVLVTDSIRPAGLPEGIHKSGTLENGQDVIVEGGVAKLPDRSSFAGSLATVDQLVRNMRDLAGVPVIDAVRMITANPARVLGIRGKKGILAPGMDADVCVFDDDIRMKAVIVGGNVMFDEL